MKSISVRLLEDIRENETRQPSIELWRSLHSIKILSILEAAEAGGARLVDRLFPLSRNSSARARPAPVVAAPAAADCIFIMRPHSCQPREYNHPTRSE